MKKFRGTLVLALIVVAVGGFALFEFKKSETEGEEKTTQDYIFRDLKAEDVTEWQAGTKFTLKKDGAWQVVAPVQDLADREAVISFFRSVFAQNVEALDTGDTDASAQAGQDAKYGFTAPLAQFEFTMVNGKKHKLVFGSVQTYDKGYYVKKDDEATIWVAGTSFDSALGRVADDFRLKNLQQIDEGVLTHLKIKFDAKGRNADVDLERVGEKGAEKWQAKGQPKLLVEGAQVEEYLDKLRELRAVSIVGDDITPETLNRHNIPKANLVIEASLKTPTNSDGNNIKVSFYVPPKGDATYIATYNKAVYTGNENTVAGLLQDLNHFRNKAFMFQYDQSQAAKLKVVHNDGVMNFEKQTLDWTLTTPQAQPAADAKTMKAANSSEVISLLSDLHNLNADSFAPAPAGLGQKSKSYIEVYDAANKLLFEFSYRGMKQDQDRREFYVAKTSLSDEYINVPRAQVDALFAKKITEDVPIKDKK